MDQYVQPEINFIAVHFLAEMEKLIRTLQETGRFVGEKRCEIEASAK